MAEWGPFDVLDNLTPEDLRQRLRSLQAVIDRAPIPIAIAHDPDCRFIFANRALAALMGLPTDVNISAQLRASRLDKCRPNGSAILRHDSRRLASKESMCGKEIA